MSPRLIFALLMSAAILCAAPSPSQTANPQLEQVLTKMDQGAAHFRSATADTKLEQYQKVVEETDTQSGKSYFRRNGNEVQMALDVEQPDKKYVIYSDGKVRFYQPRINQITEHDVGKNREDVEGFLVLGFGGGGHELLKSYDVTLGGSENVNGQNSTRLELVPKSQRLRGMFGKIVMWVVPDQSVTVRQEFFEPSGDRRTVNYSNIQLNKKISDDVFKIKTDSATKTVKQ